MDVQRVRWSQLGSAGSEKGTVTNSYKGCNETACSIYWLAQLINGSVPGSDTRALCIKLGQLRLFANPLQHIKIPGDFQSKFSKKCLHQHFQASEVTTKNFRIKTRKTLKGNLRSVCT